MTWTFERKLLGAALLGWAIVVVLNLIFGPPLGHDESAFALVARGDADWLYRSRGVTTVAQLGLWLGGGDRAMRLASALLGFSVVLSVYALGRVTFGERTAAWAAIVICGSHSMVSRNTDLLGDLPATAGVLAGMAALASELDREGGPRLRVALAAPAFAAAFYFRYGSAPVIAIAGLAALVLWWRAVWSRWWNVLAAAALLGVLLIPHFLHSIHITGTLLGVLRRSSEIPRRAYWGEGLVTYLTTNPFTYYGALITPVILGGLVGLVRKFRSRRAWFVGSVALGQLFAIGIQSHAQPRYVYIAVALLVVLGTEAWRTMVAPRPRIALWLCGLAWFGIAAVVPFYQSSIGRARGSILSAATTIQADRAASKLDRCMVIANVIPQLMWYSHCDGTALHVWVEDALAPARDRYIVSMPYGFLQGDAFAMHHGVMVHDLPTGDLRTRVWKVQ
ncbi:MAG TPA: glycosyltransferase family 39 protein [Kofleriaceae bacterium]